MKIIIRLFALASLTMLSCSPEAWAQAPKAKGSPTPQVSPSAQPAEAGNGSAPGWVPRCVSDGRAAPLECLVESAVVAKTGQLIMLVDIHVTSDTRTPVARVQLPLGINLPAGAKLQVDDGKMVDLPIQTCDGRGCYANLPIAPDVLAAMHAGKQLKVFTQDLAKETVTITMPLGDFATAYDKIK